jgi:dynein heavy chain
VNAFDNIDPEEFKKYMDEQIHGATTQIIKITDFTVNGYLPKCFLPFYTPPGALPRKVQIDRLKRLYLSMDIAELLNEKKLFAEVLMPMHRPSDEVILVNALASSESDDLAPFPAFLPLHYFDNEDFEILTAQEWLNKGVEDGVYKPIPARALLPNVASNLLSKISKKFPFSNLT